MIGFALDMDADGLRGIGEQVHVLFRRGPFGRVLKKEINEVLFRADLRNQHRSGKRA